MMRNSHRQYIWKTASVAALMAFWHQGVAAQEQDANADGQEDDELRGIEEIVVTAQRREERVQDVPLSISAFSGEDLDEDGVATLQDLGNRTPGMTFNAFAVGQPEIAIRGISTKEDGVAANDSVVVSVDGVYVAARTAQVFDIFDLERVEVLRGPQGTLAGRNAIGGAINFVTREPTDELEAKMQVTLAEYNTINVGGFVGGPLADTLRGKFSFSVRSNDGFLEPILEDGPRGDTASGAKETIALRGTLIWEPKSNLRFDLMVDGADDDIGQTNREPIGAAGPLHDCPDCASNPLAVNEALGGAGDPFTTLADVVGFTTREVFGSTLRIAYDITPNLTLRSTTTYRTSAYDYLEDSEGLPPSPFVDLTSEPQLLATLPAESGFAFDIADAVQENTNQYTQTFRLTSNPQRRFSWDVGLFGTFEDFERTEAFTNPSLGGPSGLPSINISDQENETIAFAVFGEAYYNITDRLELTVGARFDYEEKEYTASGSVPQGLPLLVFPFAEDTASESFSNPSGRFALDYALTPSVNVYGLFSTGFKSGGFTGSPSTAERAFTPFDSETALNYEAGLKGGFFDNRLRINLSAFWIDYNDLQVTRFFQPLGNDFGEFITENAGEARSRGLELEYNARPFENVLLGGSYSFLDAEFVDFQGTPSVAADGTVLDSGDFNGNDLRQAPNHTASFFAEYTYPFANGSEFKAKVNYRYQGEFFFDPDNNTLAFSEAYSLVDARLAYTFRDGQWELAVFGRNLTDEEYLTHAFTQRGSRISFGLFGDPRIFGGSVTFRM